MKKKKNKNEKKDQWLCEGGKSETGTQAKSLKNGKGRIEKAFRRKNPLHRAQREAKEGKMNGKGGNL